MILLKDYFGKWMNHEDVTQDVKVSATDLIERVNYLLDEAFEFYVDLQDNPSTGTLVSGSTYGGFRPQSCPQGAPESSHKVGKGIDIYDPKNELDNWITDTILERFDLYRENPLYTQAWCHLTTRPPKSKKRTFIP